MIKGVIGENFYDMSKWERKKSTYTGAYTFLSIIGDVVTYQTHVVG